MKKKYLIYWDSNKGIDGNVIMEFNHDNEDLQSLISRIKEAINEDKDIINNLTIKFMVELR